MTHAIPIGYRIEERSPLGFGLAPQEHQGPGSLISDDSDASLVTIAGTGTGKGVSQVIPTALTYPGSMIIVDIKGDLPNLKLPTVSGQVDYAALRAEVKCNSKLMGLT